MCSYNIQWAGCLQSIYKCCSRTMSNLLQKHFELVISVANRSTNRVFKNCTLFTKSVSYFTIKKHITGWVTKLSQNQTHPITHQIRNQTSEIKLQTSVLIIAFAGWHSQWQNSTNSWLKLFSDKSEIHSFRYYPKQEHWQAGRAQWQNSTDSSTIQTQTRLRYTLLHSFFTGNLHWWKLFRQELFARSFAVRDLP